MKSNLLVVDAQRGFTELCPNELPIPGALEIVPNINKLLDMQWSRIDATQDWHPPNHCSFLGQRDNFYPPHCVQGTPGADFIPGIKTEKFQAIWRKGFDKDKDAYSVVDQHPTFALTAGYKWTVFICGLATNICCFFAARDILKFGVNAVIVEDASAGIDVPGMLQADMKTKGQKMGIEYVLTDQICSGDWHAKESDRVGLLELCP